MHSLGMTFWLLSMTSTKTWNSKMLFLIFLILRDHMHLGLKIIKKTIWNTFVQLNVTWCNFVLFKVIWCDLIRWFGEYLVADWVELSIELAHCDGLWIDRSVDDLLIFLWTVWVEVRHCFGHSMNNACLTTKWLTNQHETKYQPQPWHHLKHHNMNGHLYSVKIQGNTSEDM